MRLPLLPLALVRSLIAGLLCWMAASGAVLASIASEIEAIERRHGADAEVVIEKIRQYEGPARKAGGADLRVFLSAWGFAHAAASKLGVAEAALADLSRLAEQTKDPETEASAYVLRASLLDMSGRVRDAKIWSDKAMPLIAKTKDGSLAYWAHSVAAILAYETGSLASAVTHFQQARQIAEASNDLRRVSQSYLNMLSVLIVMKDWDAALEAIDKGYAAAEKDGQKSLMLLARSYEVIAAEGKGDLARQRAASEASVALAEGSAGRVAQIEAALSLADVSLRAGNYETALAHAQRIAVLAAEIDDPAYKADANIFRGLALVGLRKLPEGRRLVDEGFAYYRTVEAKTDLLIWIQQYGDMLERAGDVKHALEQVREAQKMENEMVSADRRRVLLELQQKYAADAREKEIALLSRDNALKTAALAQERTSRHLWWALAAVFVLATLLALSLFLRVRRANQLLAAKNTDLEYLSAHDPLTGLLNRRHFTGVLESMATAVPHRRVGDADDLVRAVFLLDVDRFKRINDTHGHGIGDKVLVSVAHRLRAALRDSETVVRWGGEEFLVLAPAIALGQLDELAVRLLNTVGAEPVDLDGAKLRVTISLGYAPLEMPDDPEPANWEHALHRADQALFLAKRRGRNQAIGVHSIADVAALEADAETSPRSIVGPAG
ncbi:diguanylate cyclase [Niveibacterium sp. 24ML]|uniref:diguanylate cyclase n=1 Tax=Niveibacterium sp. 24ML TaxID=2985512 RepID=UPI0022710862|nr:diguanylate cyclase [Niveibacterium sp. 24ML]MCX9155029.1 diguanylate cyclase [Niveibacterium sp. 24ML]